MITPRFSKTRYNGANHTACTKLTERDSLALHLMAVEQRISDYELTRRILTAYIDVEGGGRVDISEPHKAHTRSPDDC